MLDLKTLRDNFKRELVKAHGGEKSAFRYLKTKIPTAKSENSEKRYQVMVVGGTNFSTASVFRKGSDVSLTNIKKEQFSPFKSGKALFEFLSERILPDVNIVCLNFAFPMEQIVRDGRMDGTLLSVGKDHQMDDLIGKNVGESFESYLLENFRKKIELSVANDTVCLLLSGLTVAPKEKIVGAILGTGFNLGIFDGEDIVNLEAGGFSEFEQTESGKDVDLESLKPGRSLFEKELSGAYLYRHFNYEVKNKNLDTPKLSSTKELYDIAFGDKVPAMKETAQKIFYNSAEMLAASLSGIAEFKGSEIDVVIQGGMFSDAYKDHLLETFEELSSFKMRIYKIKDSSRIGAAYLI